MAAGAVEQLTDVIRELEPQLIFTLTAALDPFNPTTASRTMHRAGAAAGERRGRGERVQTIRRPSC